MITTGHHIDQLTLMSAAPSAGGVPANSNQRHENNRTSH
jgi:hypothetical protein